MTRRLFIRHAHSAHVATVEDLRIIHLGADGRVIDLMAFRGAAHSVALPIAQIVAAALRNHARGMIVSHTHPSGDPRPSVADIRATRQLAAALRACDIYLHDHVIEAPGRSLSFREIGLL